VIIDASDIPGGGRVFDIRAAATVTLRDLTIQGGDGPPIVGSGAGIWNSGTLLLYQVNLRENRATVFGAGVFNEASAWLEIEQSTVFGNSAGHSGGGIFNQGTLVVTDSEILMNLAAGDGGGIYNHEDGDATVNRSRIGHNQTVDPGGGGPANLAGGAILNHGRVNVVNGFFSWNDARDGFGGAIANYGELETSNTTFINNRSPVGSAVYSAVSSQVSMDNTIIAGECAVDPNSFTSFGGNLESPGHTCPLDPQSDLWDIADVMFGMNGSYNGGLVYTLQLQPGSPAIDAGNNSRCQPEDLRHQPRAIDGDGDLDPVCDAGHHEYNPDELLIAGFEGGHPWEWWPVVGGPDPF
jgi:hypothetical protein